MKRIYIRHSDDITPDKALEVAKVVMRECKEKTGIVTMTNGMVVYFSDHTKNPCLTIIREKNDGKKEE